MQGQNIRIQVGEGRHQVVLQGVPIGEGVSVLLIGGEQPHIGGVVLSVPRKSLTGEGISCDSWILPVPAHRDVEAARPVAEMICRASGQTTVVTAGIHIHQAEAWELEVLLENCCTAARQFIDQFLPK